ncbi:MAG: ATP-binding protein, partial [Calditrichaceae bacterium]
ACNINWKWRKFSQILSKIQQGCLSENLIDFKFERPDGKEGFLNLKFCPLELEGTSNQGILILGEEITERKILEAQLSQAQKLESIGRLAAGIAHEINTPIQYVGDNTRFLKDSLSEILDLINKYALLKSSMSTENIQIDLINEIKEAEEKIGLGYLIEEIPQAVEQSLDGIKRISKIVSVMKEFSHPGVNKKTLIDLNKALENTVAVAKNEWKYVADVKLAFDDQLPLVPCLANEINQVFLNILINAAHAIESSQNGNPDSKGSIMITTSRNSVNAEITIVDNGCGIPESIKSKIFDPFFTTKEVGRGTGQGLAISYDIIVNKHNGKLIVESEEGKGSKFRIKLPLNTD